MEVNKEAKGMLDLMIRPAFCVKDNMLTDLNQAAQCLLLSPGTDVRELLLTGAEEYAAFQGGCLYLNLRLSAGSRGASVIRMEDQDIFVLDLESDHALRAMALAARELREPLTGMMLAAHRLAPENDAQKEQLARLNRGMHQMLRLIGNMSDAGHSADASRMELRNIPEIFAGIFEKAQAFVAQTGLTLHYKGVEASVLGLVDEALLERAVLNMLSNSIKFSPKGSDIHAQLTRRGRMLTLSIQDSGSGIAQNIQQDLFHRYLRQPGIEDGRFGLGLGMVLILSAASRHGGTVLIDQPNGNGTRVSLTLSIRQNTEAALRSPVMRVDYAGEQDHALVELADCLPLSAYRKE